MIDVLWEGKWHIFVHDWFTPTLLFAGTEAELLLLLTQCLKLSKKDPLFATAKQLCCKWMVRFIGFINVKRDTRWFFKPMWLLSKRCAWQLPKRLWKKRRPNLTCTQTCNQEEEIELLREIYLKVIYILAFKLHFLLSIIVQIRTKNICFDSMS